MPLNKRLLIDAASVRVWVCADGGASGVDSCCGWRKVGEKVGVDGHGWLLVRGVLLVRAGQAGLIGWKTPGGAGRVRLGCWLLLPGGPGQIRLGY